MFDFFELGFAYLLIDYFSIPEDAPPEMVWSRRIVGAALLALLASIFTLGGFLVWDHVLLSFRMWGAIFAATTMVFIAVAWLFSRKRITSKP